MHRRPRLSLLRLLVVALAGACGWRTGFQPFAPGPDTSARPVGLITAGSAFASAGVQRRVAEALERASRRRVVLLDAPVSARDAAVKDLAARLIRENPSIVGYDWREPRCATGAGVLTAITRQVDAVYRVSLDYVERSRPATATETAELGPLARGFRAHTASRRRRAGLRGAAGYPAVSGAGVGHGRAAAGGLGLSVRGARTRRRGPDVGTSRTDGPDGGTRHDPRGGEAPREARGRRRSARPQAGRGARAARGVGSRGGGRRRELRYPSASARAAVLVQHALRHAHDRALQPGQDPLGLTRPKMGAHSLRDDA